MRTRGDALHPDDRREVLDRYPYRMTHESIERWPHAARSMRDGGYRLPIISDAEWLTRTTFATRANGRLDRRRRACQTRHPA